MRRRGIFIALFILVVCFILSNSLLSSSASNQISDAVTKLLGGQVTDGKLVRKLAHLVEFAVLGSIVMMIASHKSGKPARQLPNAALTGILIALTDETIQLFNDRTSSVKDVWIDFYCIGLKTLKTGAFSKAFSEIFLLGVNKIATYSG